MLHKREASADPKSTKPIAGEWNNLCFQLIFFQHDRLSWPTSRDHRFGSRSSFRDFRTKISFSVFAHQEKLQTMQLFCSFFHSWIAPFRCLCFFVDLFFVVDSLADLRTMRVKHSEKLMEISFDSSGARKKLYQQFFFYLPHKVIWMLINLAT